MMDPNDAANNTIYNKSANQWIYEICQKQGRGIEPRFQVENMQTDPTRRALFLCTVTIDGYNDQKYQAEHLGRNKQEAKQKASICMLNEMGIGRLELQEFLKAPNAKGTISAAAEKIMSPDSGTIGPVAQTAAECLDDEKDYVTALKAFCLTYCLEKPVYQELSQSGMSHNLLYKMEGKISARGPKMEDIVVVVELHGKKQMIKKVLASKLLKLASSKVKTICDSVKAWGDESVQNKSELTEEFYRLCDDWVINLAEFDPAAFGTYVPYSPIPNWRKLFSHNIYRFFDDIMCPEIDRIRTEKKEIHGQEAIICVNKITEELQGMDCRAYTEVLKIFEGKGLSLCVFKFSYKAWNFSFHGKGCTLDEAIQEGATEAVEFMRTKFLMDPLNNL